jgi:diadenosine tetraphosphate (Ap4A) HIT family hydrolase
MPNCSFCERIRSDELIAHTGRAVAFRDSYPVSEGHTLVVPAEHEPDFFALPAETQAAAWELVAQVREQLAAEFASDGFNVGLNDGKAAGQTVGHAHIHVIPRYAGDIPDPRGGVRWVIPEKAVYWP